MLNNLAYRWEILSKYYLGLKNYRLIMMVAVLLLPMMKVVAKLQSWIDRYYYIEDIKL